MDDDDDLIVAETVEEDEVVEASPWTHSDTVAAVCSFAANISTAMGDFFKSINHLALAQAGVDWKQIDKEEFATDADTIIRKLTEDTDG